VSEPSAPVSLRGHGLLRPTLFMVLRLAGTITLLLVVYYLVPVRTGSATADLPWLILNLVLFALIVGIQFPLILRARFPFLRSIEAMGLSVCLFLMLFARLYVSLSAADATAFSQRLDHTDSLYFTVTVFATVGFGDVVAVTNPVKLVVTVQMILDLIVLGVVVRLLFSAGQRVMAQRQRQS
jgi:hypothetical protein